MIEQPHQGPRDRIAHQPRLMRQQGDRERRLGERDAQIGAKRAEMAARRDPGTAWHDGADDRDEGRQQDRRQDEAGPHRRGSERQRKSRKQRQHARRRGQRSPQIVEHLQAADRRHGAASLIHAGDQPAPKYPRQQLPVAARPAVVAHRVDVVTRGEVLNHLDIGGETGAGEDALEQIVAEQSRVRDPAGERGLEGIDVIDALARIRAFAQTDPGTRRRRRQNKDRCRGCWKRCAGTGNPRGRLATRA